MQKLTGLKGEIDSSTIIVGDFNTPLSIMDRKKKRQKRKIEDFTMYKPTGSNRHIQKASAQ